MVSNSIQVHLPNVREGYPTSRRPFPLAAEGAQSGGGNAAGLCALVPLAPGDHVGIWGADVGASEAITAAGALPVMIDRGDATSRGAIEDDRCADVCAAAAQAGRLPLHCASLDHLIVPELDAATEAWLPGEAARVVKPGGWAVLMVTGSLHGRRPGLLDLRSGGRFPEAAMQTRSGQCRCADWEAGGFRIVARYGRGRDARGRMATVPLERPGAVRYYLTALKGTTPRWGRLYERYAGMLINAGRPDRLFDTVVAVGQRLAD